MNFWIVFWQVMLISTILIFAGMAVWVSVQGFDDIKKLFTRIDASHAGEETGEGEET